MLRYKKYLFYFLPYPVISSVHVLSKIVWHSYTENIQTFQLSFTQVFFHRDPTIFGKSKTLAGLPGQKKWMVHRDQPISTQSFFWIHRVSRTKTCCKTSSCLDSTHPSVVSTPSPKKPNISHPKRKVGKSSTSKGAFFGE